MENPTIVEAIKKQQIEAECKPLIARAEWLVRMGNSDEARDICEKVMAQHPETDWAKRAAEILKSIEQLQTKPE